MLKRFLVVLAALAPLALMTTGCPKPLPKREKLEIRRFKVPERKHETVARIKSMEKSIEAMKSAMVSDDERTCTQDSECQLTMQHCCTCRTGGKMVGVRIDKNLALAQRRQGLCKKVACNQMVSTDPTCTDEGTVARCENGMCVAGLSGAAVPPPVPTEKIPDTP
jgi:hypothetical protein